MFPILAFCILLILVLSFIKTRLKPFAIAATGLLMGAYIIAESLKERIPSAGMASIGTGLAEAIELAALFIAYTIYLLVLVIVWWRFQKQKNAPSALQVKQGIGCSLIIFAITVLLSFLDIPKTTKYALQKRNAEAAFRHEYDLISDSINKDNKNYFLYAKRAGLGAPFFYSGGEYFFGTDEAMLADAKTAYSLNPADYNFVLSLSYIFSYRNNNTGEMDTATESIQQYNGLQHGNNISAGIKINEMGKFFLQRAQTLLLDSLNEEIIHHPGTGKWYYQRGVLYEEMGDTMNAVLNFEKLNTVQPHHEYSIYSAMAGYYLKRGEIEKSNACFRKLIGDYTFGEGPFTYLSERARLKEAIDVQAAINDYTEALKYQPANNTVKEKLRSLYLSQGDSSHAHKYDTGDQTLNGVH